MEEGTSGSVSWGDRSVLPLQEVTEKGRKSIKTACQSPKHLVLTPPWQTLIPPSPDNLEQALAACYTSQNKIQVNSLLSWNCKLLKTKQKRRGETPLGLLSNKNTHELKFLVLNTWGFAADQRLVDLLDSFVFIYSYLLILGAVVFGKPQWSCSYRQPDAPGTAMQGCVCLHVSPGPVMSTRQGELWPQPPQEGDGKLGEQN